MYGGSEKTISDQFGFEWPEARRVVDKFHRAWPHIGRPLEQNGKKIWPPVYDPWTLNGQIQGRLKERGYITTLFGRHLTPESGHKAVNTLIQGCAADLMRAALVKVHEELQEGELCSHLVSTIHDELIVDAAADEVPFLAERIPVLMNHEPVNDVVPIEVDVEWSTTTWADKEAYCTTQKSVTTTSLF